MFLVSPLFLSVVVFAIRDSLEERFLDWSLMRVFNKVYEKRDLLINRLIKSSHCCRHGVFSIFPKLIILWI